MTRIQIKQSPSRSTLIHQSFQNFISDIAKSKYFWLDPENNNNLEFNVSLTHLISKITISGPSLTPGIQLQVDLVHSESNTSTIKRVVIDGEKTGTLQLDSPIPISSLRISHSLSKWPAWQVFVLQISFTTEREETFVVYDTLSLYQSIGDLLDFSRSIGLTEEDEKKNRLLLESVFFKGASTNIKDLDINLFENIHKSISPYTLSSHGYTLPFENQENIQERVNGMIGVLNSIGLPWFCVSGTLLGITRDGKPISYDDDFDYSIYIGRVENPADLAEKLCAARKLLLPVAYQVKSYPIWYKMSGPFGAIDLFISWSDQNNKIWIWPWCAGEIELNEVFPLMEQQFCDNKVFSPKNPNECLRLNYGSNWEKPDPLWRFDWDTANRNFRDFINYTNKFFRENSAM